MLGANFEHYFDDNLPGMRHREDRDHAGGRLPIFLRVLRMRDTPAPEGRRLLRILFFRVDTLTTPPII
jgi:hypothetical protein